MDADRRRKMILMGLALAAVWGYVFHTLFGGSSRPESDKPLEKKQEFQKIRKMPLSALEAHLQKALELKTGVPTYKSSGSDPFGGYEILKLTVKKDDIDKSSTKAPVQTQLRLLGIVWDDKKPYALVTHANGRSYDVTEGAVVEDEKISSITRNHIIIEKEGEKFELTTSGFRKL